MNEMRIVALVDAVTHPSQRCGWVGLGLELGGDWVLCVCVWMDYWCREFWYFLLRWCNFFSS